MRKPNFNNAHKGFMVNGIDSETEPVWLSYTERSGIIAEFSLMCRDNSLHDIPISVARGLGQLLLELADHVEASDAIARG